MFIHLQHEVPSDCGCSPCAEFSESMLDVRMQKSAEVSMPLLQLLGHRH